MGYRAPGAADVEVFLTDYHGGAVADVEPLQGGFWSSAYGYRVGEQELVARFGADGEGFELDRAATAFARPGLPVPHVLDVGTAFDGAFALSVRHHGRFLETIRPEEADAAGPALDRLLAALRAAPFAAGPDAGPSSWRDWLAAGLVDDPSHPVSGWRKTIAAEPELDDVFRACEARMGELLNACPERRDLVHGDLLHQNVLVSEDASRVTAVFSWKCSTRGDFLYDVAWCTFWSAWHPGIAALDAWDRTVRGSSLPDDALVSAGVRHHCYEVQIGASHMGWYAWSGDREGLDAVVERTRGILARGPLMWPADSR